MKRFAPINVYVHVMLNLQADLLTSSTLPSAPREMLSTRTLSITAREACDSWSSSLLEKNYISKVPWNNTVEKRSLKGY